MHNINGFPPVPGSEFLTYREEAAFDGMAIEAKPRRGSRGRNVALAMAATLALTGGCNSGPGNGVKNPNGMQPGTNSAQIRSMIQEGSGIVHSATVDAAVIAICDKTPEEVRQTGCNPKDSQIPGIGTQP